MTQEKPFRKSGPGNPPGTGMIGVFITFEGCEGSGKTTQVDMLRDHLASLGHEVVVSREPGGTPLGEKIREVLLDPCYEGMSPVAEALLFAADRVQKIQEVIKPALANGWVVIGDRFVDSSLAYQGVGRGVGIEAVKNLNEWATGELQPTLTFYLDVAVKQAMARKSREEPDRMEKESVEFHENVRHAYGLLAKIFSHRIVVLDATASRQQIHSNVVHEVDKLVL